MTCHVRRAFNVRFILQVILKTIVERMHVFSRATDVGKSVTRHAAAEFSFKGARWWAIEVLQIENRGPQ